MRRTVITTLLEREREDPSVSVDTISNDNTDELFENPETDGTGAVIDFASEKLGKIQHTKSYTITQFTPMTIMTSKSPNGEDIGALVLLCKDANSDMTFTLTVNYIIENTQQKAQIEKNPIHDNVNYISKRLASNMIMNAIPGYITDMRFYYNTDENDDPNHKFYLFAVPNREDNTRQVVKFNMSADIFSSLAFIDDYIVSDCHNIYDLQIATIAGYRQSDMVVPVNFVDTVDSIIKLAPTADKDSTDILTVLRVYEFVDASTKNIYKILSAFDFGKKYNKKKFRGATQAELENNYGQDVDQYLCNYMFDCRLRNLDKEYLVIKAKNKNGVCKMFFFDNDCVSKIEELVEMY